MAVPPFKRSKPEATGAEIGGNEEPTATGLGEKDKIQALKFCYHLIVSVNNHAGIEYEEGTIYDLALDYALTNLVYQLHQAHRQSWNKRGSASTKFFDQGDITITIHDTTVLYKMETLKDIYKDTLTLCEFTQDNRETWMENVHTLLSLLLLGYERLKEAHVLPTAVVVGKTSADGKTVTKSVALTSIGIPPQMRHYCVELCWRPSMRAALAQSTGPLTQVVLLSTSENDHYADKWVNAVTRTYAYVPGIESIARVLKESKPDDARGIVSKLALITMLVGVQFQHRVSLPPCVWVLLLTKEGADKDKKFDEVAAVKYDFSGKGAFLAYQAAMKMGPIFTLNLESCKASQQLAFHMCFGTWTEDFGILEFVTGVKGWLTREEMVPYFKDVKGTAGKNVSRCHFSLVPLEHYCGTASATVGSLASVAARATNARLSLAGLKVRKFTPEQGFSSCQQTVLEAEATLEAYLSSLRAQIGEKDFQTGTAAWKRMALLTDTTEGPDLNVIPAETGKLFWSNY